MKKHLFLVILFFVFILSISAAPINTNGHNFSIGASFGIIYGETEEVAYRDNSWNYLSQLLWQMKPVMLPGLDIHYDWRESIFVNASFKFGIPGKWGNMEDRDWMMPQSDWITHFSFHDNKTERAILADLEFGKTFSFRSYLGLNVFLSYRFMFFSFTASRGTFLYPESGGGHFYWTGNDKMALYEQTWHVLSPGVSFYGVFNKYFDIEILLNVTPLVLANTLDRHLLRGLKIYDKNLFPAFYIEPGLLFSFKANPSLILALSLNYRNISFARGDSIYVESGMPDETYRDTGGAGYNALSVSLGAKIKILESAKP